MKEETKRLIRDRAQLALDMGQKNPLDPIHQAAALLRTIDVLDKLDSLPFPSTGNPNPGALVWSGTIRRDPDGWSTVVFPDTVLRGRYLESLLRHLVATLEYTP